MVFAAIALQFVLGRSSLRVERGIGGDGDEACVQRQVHWIRSEVDGETVQEVEVSIAAA